jgi:hypothetical protein
MIPKGDHGKLYSGGLYLFSCYVCLYFRKVDSSLAQVVLQNFMEHHGIAIAEDSTDYLEDMHSFLQNVANEERKNNLSFLLAIHPFCPKIIPWWQVPDDSRQSYKPEAEEEDVDFEADDDDYDDFLEAQKQEGEEVPATATANAMLGTYSPKPISKPQSTTHQPPNAGSGEPPSSTPPESTSGAANVSPDEDHMDLSGDNVPSEFTAPYSEEINLIWQEPPLDTSPIIKKIVLWNGDTVSVEYHQAGKKMEKGSDNKNLQFGTCRY